MKIKNPIMLKFIFFLVLAIVFLTMNGLFVLYNSEINNYMSLKFYVILVSFLLNLLIFLFYNAFLKLAKLESKQVTSKIYKILTTIITASAIIYFISDADSIQKIYLVGIRSEDGLYVYYKNVTSEISTIENFKYFIFMLLPFSIYLYLSNE